MKDVANLMMLGLIISLLAGGLLRRDLLFSALFLIGFTQIGEIFPFLAAVRIEMVAGVLMLVAIAVTADARARLGANGDPLARSFYAFVAVVLLSIPLAVSIPDSIYWLIYYIKRCFVIYIGVVALLSTAGKMRTYIHLYLAAIFWMALIAVLDYFSGQTLNIAGVERVQGATGLLSNPNGMANTMVGALPLAYYMALYHWRRSSWSWILMGGGLAMLGAIFFSGSRGGFIGLVAALGAIALLARRRSVALVVVSVVLLVSLTMVGPELIGRYATILEGVDSGMSAGSRWVGLQHGFAMMIRRPLLGVGIGCYPVARSAWFGWSLWAHNTYGQVMGELGLAGLVAWGFLVGWTIRGTRQIRRMIGDPGEDADRRFIHYLSLGIEVSTYARLVLGMTTHSIHVFFWYLNAGLVVCMSLVAKGWVSEENGEAPPRSRRRVWRS